MDFPSLLVFQSSGISCVACHNLPNTLYVPSYTVLASSFFITNAFIALFNNLYCLSIASCEALLSETVFSAEAIAAFSAATLFSVQLLVSVAFASAINLFNALASTEVANLFMVLNNAVLAAVTSLSVASPLVRTALASFTAFSNSAHASALYLPSAFPSL